MSNPGEVVIDFSLKTCFHLLDILYRDAGNHHILKYDNPQFVTGVVKFIIGFLLQNPLLLTS